jgi:hypothetical protein
MPSIDGKAKIGERSMEMPPGNSLMFSYRYSIAKNTPLLGSSRRHTESVQEPNFCGDKDNFSVNQQD